MNSPLFSIAIPTFNRLELLKQAVASVLQQTYANFELVIFNNASTDGTKEWVDQLVSANPKVKARHNSSNVGAIGNLKLIPPNIQGEYLVVLSDDDLLHPEFVTSAVHDLTQHEDAVIWYCRAHYVDAVAGYLTHDTRIAPLLEDGCVFVKQCLLGKREPMFCATVFKVATLNKIGGFIGNKMTLDFSTRSICAAQGKVLFNPKVLAQYCLQRQGSVMFAADLWFNAVKEIQEIVVKHCGSKYKFAAIYYRFLIMESFLNRNDLDWRKRFFNLQQLFLEQPFWFSVIFLRRFIFVVLRFLPETVYAKICQIYWRIKSAIMVTKVKS